jgi:hypothetical protein
MNNEESACHSAAIGGIAGFCVVAAFIFYAEWFDAHHIVECADKPGIETAVTRWDWIRSWVFPTYCD